MVHFNIFSNFPNFSPRLSSSQAPIATPTPALFFLQLRQLHPGSPHHHRPPLPGAMTVSSETSMLTSPSHLSSSSPFFFSGRMWQQLRATTATPATLDGLLFQVRLSLLFPSLHYYCCCCCCCCCCFVLVPLSEGCGLGHRCCFCFACLELWVTRHTW